jgi:septal ring factor EnvC (AmiA/AmiB activator)
MSQLNQSNPQQPIQNSPGKKNNSIIYWVIILVLLAGCLYLFMSKNKMAEDNSANIKMEQKQIDSVNAVRTALQTDFDAASAKIDQLVTQNSKMDSALEGNKAEMAKMQVRIKGILSKEKATDAELREARDLIASLTDKTKQYEARIAELEKENTVLTDKNTVLTQERDSTVTTNIALKKIGSVLHASNIRMEPLHKRKNGKEKETSKAKRVDVLHIIFDIDENRIAESGTKQIYLRIIAPDQTILGNTANMSGMMTLNNGGQLGFSVLKEIPLTQNQMVKDVTVDWNQDGDYKKGQYTIEIYNEGYKIGRDQVTLR